MATKSKEREMQTWPVEGERIPPPAGRDMPVEEPVFDIVNVSKLRDVLVDFDGTICPFVWPGEPPAPYPGVRESMLAMKKRGYRVVIFTARAWRGWMREKGYNFYADQLQVVHDYIKKYDLPVDEVSNIKRPCILLVDDSSVNPTHEPGGPEDYWVSLATGLRRGGQL